MAVDGRYFAKPGTGIYEYLCAVLRSLIEAGADITLLSETPVTLPDDIAALIGYASLFDFGVGLAAMKMIAELSIEKDRAKISALVSNAIVTYAGMGLIVMLAGLALLPVFPSLFNIPPELVDQTNLAYIIVVVATGLTFMGASLTAALQGLHDFKTFNGVVMLQTLFTAVASIVAVEMGQGIVALSLIYAVSCVMGVLVKLFFVTVRHGVRVSPRHLNQQIFKRMLRFSSSVFVINVGSRIIFDTDALVIGRFLGTHAVAAYQVALGPGTALRKVGDQLNSITLTAASKLHAQRDTATLRRLLLEATRFTLVLMLPIIMAITVLGQDFIRLWVGAEFTSSYASLVVLAISMVVVNIQSTSSQIIMALNRHQNLAKVVIAEAAANLTLSIILLHHYGITGVALGTAIPTILTALGYVLPAACRMVGLPLRSIIKIFAEIILAMALAAPILIGLERMVDITNLAEIILIGAVYYGCCLAILAVVSPDARRQGLQTLRQVTGH